MSDTTTAILLSWELQPFVTLLLLLMGALYTRGWLRLRGKAGQNQLSRGWRLASYYGGLLLVFLALNSPIETLSGQLFTFHMIQHLMLAMFAPPLLMAANPMPIAIWGLPLPLRRRIGGLLFTKKSPLRPLLEMVTRPAITWLLFFIFLWGWHDSQLYNLTLRNEWVHDLEHFTFFWTAIGLWWHITGAGPRLHRRFAYPARIAFTLSCAPANMIAGVVIALSESVIYTYYLSVPFRVGNLSVLEDQQLGGVIMWVPGSMMYIIATVVLIAVWLADQEKKAPLDIAALHRRGKFDAPHLK